jgi:hypothetical protein
VIKHVGFGGDDCDFLLAFSLSGLIMVGNFGEKRGAMPEDSWVGREVLETASHFLSDGVGIVPHCPIGRREDWEIFLSKVADRICSRFPGGSIPMCEAVFKEAGFRLPLSPFQVSVFEWLELCPSQLKSDSFAYLTAFELVCCFLQLSGTEDLFFTIFAIQRGLDKDGGCNWVFFSASVQLYSKSLVVVLPGFMKDSFW